MQNIPMKVKQLINGMWRKTVGVERKTNIDCGKAAGIRVVRERWILGKASNKDWNMVIAAGRQ